MASRLCSRQFLWLLYALSPRFLTVQFCSLSQLYQAATAFGLSALLPSCHQYCNFFSLHRSTFANLCPLQSTSAVHSVPANLDVKLSAAATRVVSCTLRRCSSSFLGETVIHAHIRQYRNVVTCSALLKVRLRPVRLLLALLACLTICNRFGVHQRRTASHLMRVPRAYLSAREPSMALP